MFKEILDDECGSGVTVDLEGVNNGGVLPFPEGLGTEVTFEELFWAACAACAAFLASCGKFKLFELLFCASVTP